VDGILDRHSTDRLKPTPNLDAQIWRFGRQLMEQGDPS